MTASALLVASLLVGGGGDDDKEAVVDRSDHTGIAWVLPFKAAKARAEADHRLLLIKPIAFGTEEKSGCW